jgi:hypothetical protein
MLSPQTLAQVNAELAQAEAARFSGLEGRARVCARRASGLALKEYFLSLGIRPASTSAYDLIQLFRDHPATPAALRRCAENLLAKVDEQFNLPEDVDLIMEARTIIQSIAKDSF